MAIYADLVPHCPPPPTGLTGVSSFRMAKRPAKTEPRKGIEFDQKARQEYLGSFAGRRKREQKQKKLKEEKLQKKARASKRRESRQKLKPFIEEVVSFESKKQDVEECLLHIYDEQKGKKIDVQIKPLSQ